MTTAQRAIPKKPQTAPASPPGSTERSEATLANRGASAPTESSWPGARLGADAALYYADLVVRGQEDGGTRGAIQQAIGWTGGLLASLWTPETAPDTALVLGTAAGGGIAGGSRLGTAGEAISTAAAAATAWDAGIAWGEALGGQSSGYAISDRVSGRAEPGRALTSEERLQRLASGMLNLTQAVAGVVGGPTAGRVESQAEALQDVLRTMRR